MVSTAVALGLTVITLIVFTALGIWFSRGQVDSVEDFITARNSTGEGRTTATLIASVMGVWILLSAPEAGAHFGITAVIGYGIGEALPMLAYSKLGPRIRNVIPNGHSLTEYTYVRYGDVMYGFVILVSVFYMFVFLAAELTGIALALSFVATVPQWQTAVLVGGFVLLYTSYGGLRASIFTDTIQALLILPLLVLTFAGVILALGGTDAVYHGIVATDPSLLNPTSTAGLQFGLALAFAVLGAELINQTWWQRIYAGEDSETIERSFRNATIANGLIIFLAALFGIVAVGTADIENPSVAFFTLLGSAFPEWIVLAVILLALMLVMSSIDTLFNALSSLVTADLPRPLSDPDDRTLALGARTLTVVVAVAAIYVSLRARSVLTLFLFADLLGAAVAFPLVFGLYSRQITGTGALVSSLTGLAIGAAYFPFPLGLADSLRVIPVLGKLLPAPDALYLTSFASAFLVSAGLTLVLSHTSSSEFELDQLSGEIRRLDEPETDGGSPVDESDAETEVVK